MSDLIQNPGESLADAIRRIAREAAKESVNTPVVVPGVRPSKNNKPAPKTNKPRKATQAAASTRGGDPSVGADSGRNDEIVSAIHFYCREGELLQKSKMRAQQERGMHGPNVLVFAHEHCFGVGCTDQCKVTIGEAE